MGEEETERHVPGRPAGVGAQRCILIAVPPDRNQNPVRLCATFTEDLQQLVDWLVGCDVTTVAMESTGVYWIPLSDKAGGISQNAFLGRSTSLLGHSQHKFGLGFGFRISIPVVAIGWGVRRVRLVRY